MRTVIEPSSSSSLTFNLLKSDQLLTTHWAGGEGERAREERERGERQQAPLALRARVCEREVDLARRPPSTGTELGPSQDTRTFASLISRRESNDDLREVTMITCFFFVFYCTTRWSTTLSSKVNLPCAINFRALCGAKLVTYLADFRGVETLELHRVVTLEP